ncbi:MAG: hypothetical protein A3C58_00090 [Candidatus Staskawiczbacteria bacterium RIFCSPHIGHO2_02_FULL_34_10]|uniref:DUF3307 domain-containing protein n=2 Tax=Candidatus Staskawicziibacteriota TaxID=1817916 RepID=A0A1G2HL50_9BACT|nr:MAG: hypothetical protein A2639_03240 [Candidatus Staskawiczbacteria bacterium RIFCSPHIGHO2_01_FULL_34_27]OGZ66629.1 MAG: hypothetical protein A3C58_00090 [Candidatus Staskawiczbacteria bacterium RIFCSPHIGHO2_02_FULL_34_10]
MILLAHMLFGAAIGASIKNLPLAIILAFLGHYFLDLFPHVEYDIENIKNKNWKKSLPDFSRVFLDFSIGIIIIFLFSKNQPIIYVCGFIALVPDGLTLISYVFPNKVSNLHDTIHTQHIHYLTKKKRFPIFWRILTQVLAVIVSIILLKS